LWKRSAVAGVIPGQAGELRGIGGLDADGQHEIVPASTAEASHGCGVPRLRRLHQTSLTCRGWTRSRVGYPWSGVSSWMPSLRALLTRRDTG
jgi:hypothetical protein